MATSKKEAHFKDKIIYSVYHFIIKICFYLELNWKINFITVSSVSPTENTPTMQRIYEKEKKKQWEKTK